jgi:hypothetical protein
MLVSVTENVASPQLQPTGPTADTSTIISISRHNIADRLALHFPQSPRPNSSLQSALETSMREVIPDVLNNLSQGNSFSMGIDSWGHDKSYHKPGQ